MRAGFVGASLFLLATHGQGEPPKSPEKSAEKATDGWRSLFDGKSLGAWKSTEFVHGGVVDVHEGALRLGKGDPMTGVVYKGPPLPKIDYEIAWEAKRTEGDDFFCALTFPVNDSPCSIVVAGWGGNVTGLSSLNGSNASENATTTYVKIENDKWRKFRLKVTATKIEAWVDEEQVVDVDPSEYELSIRIEMERCKPFGFASYRSTGLIKNIRIRDLKARADKKES
jgi:hypothetical protein